MRDLIGYGLETPKCIWPNQAKLAISFVINYEEGSELTPVNGDSEAETYGCDFPFSRKAPGERHYSVESFYEYGSRVGIWRLIRLFEIYQIPVTFFICGQALTLNPALASYLAKSPHELAGHGWRWINYATQPLATEEAHINQSIETITQLTGKRPKGWYTGRRSNNTRDLLLKIGGFVYDSDSYADELPYKIGDHLIIPYSLDCNDFRYTTSPGFNTGQDFLVHLKSTFDYLYQEDKTAIMTIGLHPRLSGYPGRCNALKQFLDYVAPLPNVWITRRIDIANYWLATLKE
jgi:peptidoglycan/xylan/chitin deacetylase (PgdA/CDA1 family)